LQEQKTRVLHQHLCLGEELPGLHCKTMKNFVFDKQFFEKAFSKARMKAYYDHSDGNEECAAQSYEQNILLAEALVPALSTFEVTLKNALIHEMETLAGSKDWFSYFGDSPTLNQLRANISTAIKHITTRGETVTADKINGELTLGFWVSLLNAEYEKVLWKSLRRAFPNLPKTQRQRRRISAPLNAIRSLRNRVFHNESIGWNLDRLNDYYQMITEVIYWINPSVNEWMKRVDRFKNVLNNIRLQRLDPSLNRPT